MISLNYTIDIVPERSLITGKIYGLWTRDIAEEYIKEYRDVAGPLLGGRWARLTILTNWKSSYPEIIEIIGDLLRWTQQHGAIFTVYVVDNPVIRKQLQRIVDSGDVTSITKIFHTYEEADRFLKNNGF